MGNNSEMLLPLPADTGLHDTMQPGESVVITLLNGRKITGRFNAYSAMEGHISVFVEGREKAGRVPLQSVKLLSFPTPHRWERRSSSIGDKDGVILPPLAQSFEIVFKDGGVINGETLAVHTDQFGLHLFPPVGDENYIRTFSSFQCIEKYRVGELLGELLVKEQRVKKEDLVAVLNAQREKRELPLGEYLKTTAVVSSEELERALTRQKSMPNLRLGEILIMEGLLTLEQIEGALEQQKKERNLPLGEILVKRGLVTENDVQLALAKKLGIPFVNLREFQIEPDVITIVPRDLAERHEVMPVAVYEGKLVVAMENPMNTEALDDLRFHTKLFAEAVVSTSADIRWAINFYYPSMMDDTPIGELAAVEAGDDSDKDMSGDEQALADNVVVKLINKIIVDAHEQGVSDIHIEPYPGKGKISVRFRKDGTLINYHELPGQYRSSLISRIKIMAHLDISERRKPQDGKIDFKKFGPLKIELRVATLPTTGGMEDVVLRILASNEPVPLDKLGLSEGNKKNLLDAIGKPYGLFLVCGPTGSGKTTTLHSILGHLNTPERKIWTAEDPVEITQKGLRQVQVIPKIGLTFAAAMRSFLRADPDVVMVGEMRDQETTHIGVEASLTGHLVFSTLHTNSAPESIVRLLDMGMDPFNFADALLGILAQRLAKRLCANCKQPYAPTPEQLWELADEYCPEGVVEGKDEVISSILADWQERYADPKGGYTLYAPGGCSKCDNTGYRGRIGIHELLVGSPVVKKAIIDHVPVADLVRTAIDEGMKTLKQDGIDKVLQGHTDISRIRAVCSK